jgi:hypothetical protein
MRRNKEERAKSNIKQSLSSQPYYKDLRLASYTNKPK